MIFAGFSPESIKKRIQDCQSAYVVTLSEGVRGGKSIALKQMVDQAIEGEVGVKNVLVIDRYKVKSLRYHARDVAYEQRVRTVHAHCPAEPMHAEDPLFILYTSGSTSVPKGLLHTSGGYLTYASFTHAMVFDYRPSDVYWCTADLGWITGHSYVLYGPLANGATTLMFEGVPTFPCADRFWQVVEKHRVSLFYSAPTILRSLMRLGDEHVQKHELGSLRVHGSVGEPLNPSACDWYRRVVGRSTCSIVDTWWQTETGGMMITAQAGKIPGKSGSVSQPFYGIQPCLIDNEGKEIHAPNQPGRLCIKDSWPGQMRSVYGDYQRFVDTYFTEAPGYYFSGDAAYVDADGDYWINGRTDDILIISGHNLGSAEIENALVAYEAVAEAAVVGIAHPIKGQGLVCFVSLQAQVESGDPDEMVAQLSQWVRLKIGPIATPDRIHLGKGLPKTRSGKIMRRILRKIAEGEKKDFGNITTLADPSVVSVLVEEHQRFC